MTDRKVFTLSHPLARRNAQKAVAEAPEGHRVEIKPRTRSLDQNDRMWAMLADIAAQVTWSVNGKQEYLDAEEWKNVFSASLAEENRMAMGLRGGFVMLGKRTSRMTIRQMTELIELMFAFGAEHGVRWSDPAEVMA
nr:recombination protein NinB [Pseudomonas sp.]